MRIFEDLQQWIAFRKTLDTAQTLGFAPTMGNLHKGHASLFLASKQENDLTLSSLFINPTQFNSSTDFIHYPKTLDEDLKLMEASGVDFCILPQQQDMYPDAYSYQVHENQYSLLLEGQHRPGHFQGVLTVVMKLLNLMRPHRIYMGEKDFQQFKLIKSMVSAFFLEVEVKMCPTIREASGLACSSRNNRLNPEQKKQAETFAKIFHQRELSCGQIIHELEALGIKVEYVEELEDRRFAAVVIGEIRLIDNYSIFLMPRCANLKQHRS